MKTFTGTKIIILLFLALKSSFENRSLGLFWIFLFNMREVISGSFFSHNKRMKVTFIQSRIVRGGSSKIEQCEQGGTL